MIHVKAYSQGAGVHSLKIAIHECLACDLTIAKGSDEAARRARGTVRARGGSAARAGADSGRGRSVPHRIFPASCGGAFPRLDARGDESGRLATGARLCVRAFVQSRATYGDLPTVAGAQQLLEQKVDLVMVASTAHAVAAHRATPRVPIVMWASGYPVEAGLAAGLARPGKNVTGMTVYAGTGIWGKLIELLRASKPGIKRIGVAWGYVPPAFPREEIEPCYRELRQAASTLGLALHIEEIAKPDAVPAGLAAIEAAGSEALIIAAGPGFYAERHRVMRFAMAKRLPTMADYRWPDDVAPRPLLTYGVLFPALMRQAAAYVERILQGGAKPGALPIQQPTTFEFVVNLRTAKAIGITIPQSMLIRADEVIQQASGTPARSAALRSGASRAASGSRRRRASSR